MSYAGAAANVVGGELQGWASVLDKQNMYDAFLKQQATQQGFREEGGRMLGDFATGMGSTQAATDLSAGAGGRMAAYAKAGVVPMQPVNLPYMQSSSTARDNAFSASRGQTRANLGAYSDWSLNQTLRNIQNTERLRNLTSRASGSAGVYPYLAYAAQHSNDDLAMIGAAISSIGGGSANYAQMLQGPQTTSGGGGGQFPNQPLYNNTYMGDMPDSQTFNNAATALG